MSIGMKHGQRPGRAFSNILKCSIISRGSIQPWDIVPQFSLNWMLRQPNVNQCPKKRGGEDQVQIKSPKTCTNGRSFAYIIQSCHPPVLQQANRNVEITQDVSSNYF